MISWKNWQYRWGAQNLCWNLTDNVPYSEITLILRLWWLLVNFWKSIKLWNSLMWQWAGCFSSFCETKLTLLYPQGCDLNFASYIEIARCLVNNSSLTELRLEHAGGTFWLELDEKEAAVENEFIGLISKNFTITQLTVSVIILSSAFPTILDHLHTFSDETHGIPGRHFNKK